MRKILKSMGLYTEKEFISVFPLSGILEKNKDIEDNQVGFGIILGFSFLSLNLIFLIILMVFISNKINNIPDYYLYINLFVLIYLINLLLNFKKDISKINKKIIRKSFDIDFKDKKFKLFINEYFIDIKNLNLSKKETIELINDWKKNEKELFNKKIEKEILLIEENNIELEKTLNINNLRLKELK